MLRFIRRCPHGSTGSGTREEQPGFRISSNAGNGVVFLNRVWMFYLSFYFVLLLNGAALTVRTEYLWCKDLASEEIGAMRMRQDYFKTVIIIIVIIRTRITVSIGITSDCSCKDIANFEVFSLEISLSSHSLSPSYYLFKASHLGYKFPTTFLNL